MATNFLLANALSSIVNSRSGISYLPYSNFILSVVKMLNSSALLSEVEIESNINGVKIIKTKKASNNFGFFIKEIKLFSKPGKRVYLSIKELKKLYHKDTFRFYLISTSLGIIKIKDAIEKNIGGEIICEVVLN